MMVHQGVIMKNKELYGAAEMEAERVTPTHHLRLSFCKGKQHPFAYEKGDAIIYEKVTHRFMRQLSKRLAPNRNVWKRFKHDFTISFTSALHGAYGNVHPHVHINLRKPNRVSEAGLFNAVVETATIEPWIRQRDPFNINLIETTSVKSIRYGMREGLSTIIV